MKILLATRNAKKLRELQRILDAAPDISDVTILGLSDVEAYVEVPESGLTFDDNALLKAREGAAHTGLPTVADDSGLAVDVMGGMPGIFSARWSGKHGDDDANVDLLLAQVGDVPDEALTASFVCSAALALPTAGRSPRRDECPAALFGAGVARVASATTRSSSPPGTRGRMPS